MSEVRAGTKVSICYMYTVQVPSVFILFSAVAIHFIVKKPSTYNSQSWFLRGK